MTVFDTKFISQVGHVDPPQMRRRPDRSEERVHPRTKVGEWRRVTVEDGSETKVNNKKVILRHSFIHIGDGTDLQTTELGHSFIV